MRLLLGTHRLTLQVHSQALHTCQEGQGIRGQGRVLPGLSLLICGMGTGMGMWLSCSCVLHTQQ